MKAFDALALDNKKIAVLHEKALKQDRKDRQPESLSGKSPFSACDRFGHRILPEEEPHEAGLSVDENGFILGGGSPSNHDPHAGQIQD
jgi:hypothetical protein